MQLQGKVENKLLAEVILNNNYITSRLMESKAKCSARHSSHKKSMIIAPMNQSKWSAIVPVSSIGNVMASALVPVTLIGRVVSSALVPVAPISTLKRSFGPGVGLEVDNNSPSANE
mmetsp:Transcript_57920/g.78949  ORF Transcript_57920/g.78949 Transcript_57920/m.78949 type:complete len:116 (-) Transcript_57920:145-492(-)